MIQILPNIFAVKVPVDTTGCEIVELDAEDNLYQLEYTRMNDDEESGFYGEYETTIIDLPVGTYEYLFLSSEVTDEDCRKVVEELRDDLGFFGYKNYSKEFSPIEENYPTPTESFHSLMQSHKLEGNYAIIKQLK